MGTKIYIPGPLSTTGFSFFDQSCRSYDDPSKIVLDGI
jgi:hypothetical protein